MNSKVAALMEALNISERAACEIVAYDLNGRREELVRRPQKNAMPCEVYSRVVGYMRPVSQWNPGKQEEFRERQDYAMKARRGCL
jgi:anaerobic ribonucleoside-triphosphate reductase